LGFKASYHGSLLQFVNEFMQTHERVRLAAQINFLLSYVARNLFTKIQKRGVDEQSGFHHFQ